MEETKMEENMKNGGEQKMKTLENNKQLKKRKNMKTLIWVI